MVRGARLRQFLSIFAIVFLFFCVQSFLRSEDTAKGNIIGFVYSEDGTTPLEGVTVNVMNVSSGDAYGSTESDSLGIFKIEGVERGIYILGAQNEQGNFNADDFLGISFNENEAAKFSISLVPFERRYAAAIQELYEGQKEGGTSLVGKIISYDSNTRMAEVFLEKGLLRLDDRINTHGKHTDFYQDIKYMELNGSSVKSVYAGQTASIGVKDKVEIGDSIYTVSETEISPLHLSPVGNASVIAGSPSVSNISVQCTDQWICPSPFRKWKKWWWWFWKYREKKGRRWGGR